MTLSRRDRAAWLLLLLAGCSVSAIVGSRWLVSQTVQPGDGATLTVAVDANEPLEGASLTVPPQALGQDTLVGAAPCADQSNADFPSAGPCIEWDPLDAGVRGQLSLVLPVALAGGQPPQSLAVLATGERGAELIDQLQFDTASSTVRFSSSHFGTFQAVLPVSCFGRGGCLPQDVCDHGSCRPGGGDGDDGGPPP